MKEKVVNINFRILNHNISAKKILLHPLFSGSFFMIFGSNLANFIAYIYHLVLGRIIGPSLYGELVAVLSFLGLILSTVSFFGMVIVKFVSSAPDKEVPGILDWFNRKTLVAAFLVALLVLILYPFLGDYMHISKNIALLFVPILFVSVISYIYKMFLQGVVKFKQAAIVINVELLGRLLFGLFFVLVGTKVFGAMVGLLLSVVCGLFLSRYYLRDVGFTRMKIEGFHWKRVMKYAVPVFLVSLSFTSLLTTDVILVKHFFTSYQAGIYGSVSNLGKIIFYASSPVGAVMFPLIAKKKSKNQSVKSIFLLSALLVLGLGSAILFIYYLFPVLVVEILYTDKFIEATSYLLLMGAYFILYSGANLFSSFLLSIDRTKPLLILPAFAVMQVVGIYIFHNDFYSIIRVSITCISLLLIYLGLYFVYAKRPQRV